MKLAEDGKIPEDVLKNWGRGARGACGGERRLVGVRGGGGGYGATMSGRGVGNIGTKRQPPKKEKEDKKEEKDKKEESKEAAYIQGFIDKCAAAKVEPELLLKRAFGGKLKALLALLGVGGSYGVGRAHGRSAERIAQQEEKNKMVHDLKKMYQKRVLS